FCVFGTTKSAFGFFLVIALPAIPQQRGSDRLVSDVVSVKPSKAGAVGGIVPLPGGIGYNATATLKVMLSVMYRIPLRQIVGGPEWTSTEKFDVRLKANKAYSIEDLHVMFQNALVDRFGLKVHFETKQGPVFVLRVATSGMKMIPVEAGADRNIPISDGPNQTFIGRRVPMNYFCYWLGQRLQNDQRPVIDGTGLTGQYDFTLAFRPELAPQAESSSPDLEALPTIFDAVRNQLGLELVPQTGPVPMLVIDQVNRPSED
ncbi:MAG: TIGR03435 family protein, partial [Terriglobus sp.]